METQIEKQIIQLLSDIEQLLDSVGYKDYAQQFNSFHRDLSQNTSKETVIVNILKSFRGAGSFNDVVISTPR